MKFYSEKLDKMFDTLEQLEQEEQNLTKKSSTKKNKSEKSSVNEEIVSPTKKQLAAEIDAKEEALKEAYSKYDAAKSEVEAISKEYLSMVESILGPAKLEIQKAEKERYEAIRRFNDAFGAYQVTYTGARAADEMAKAISSFNDRSSKLFRNLFWF